jgi:hypothetical protein
MDRREMIMARLLAVAGSVEGVVLASRNDRNIDEGLRPAVYLYDADEHADETDPTEKRRLGQPRRVRMVPQIYLVLGKAPEDLGTAINVMRARLLKAILTDTELQGIVGNNGDIRYEGCSTELQSGRTMEGEVLFAFSFLYYLVPSEL